MNAVNRELKLGRAARGQALVATLSGILPLAGCYFTPTEQERLEQSVVVTARDPAADLASYQSYFIRPEIRVLDEQDGLPTVSNTELLPEAAAAPLLNSTEANLSARGYVAASSSEEAELAVELVYVRSVDSDFYCANWGDWAYWGYPGWSYYFPYPCGTSAWYTGMLVTHVVDLAAARAARAAQPDTLGMLRGVWLSGVYGAEVESASFQISRAAEGIDEAFAQSPYFVRTPAPASDTTVQ